MSAGTGDLKKTIKALKSTHKIVRITELSTLGKLSGLRKSAEDAVTYYETILKSLNQVRETTFMEPATRAAKKITALVITSDRGLCGAYNSDIFQQIDYFLEQVPKDAELEFIVVGNQGYEYLLRKNQKVAQFLQISLEEMDLEKTTVISSDLIAKMNTENLDELYVIFTKYISAVQSEAQISKIYPDIPTIMDDTEDKVLDYVLDYDEADDDVEELLLENYVCGLLYSMFLYSVASEYCMRRIAMKEAKDNIHNQLNIAIQMKKKLDLQKKTSELQDIISSAQVIREDED